GTWAFALPAVPRPVASKGRRERSLKRRPAGWERSGAESPGRPKASRCQPLPGSTVSDRHAPGTGRKTAPQRGRKESRLSNLALRPAQDGRRDADRAAVASLRHGVGEPRVARFHGEGRKFVRFP